MANFKYSLTSELFTNENPVQKLDRKVALADANEKVVLDHDLPVGAFSLAAALAQIADLKAILIVASGDGFTIKHGGQATFSTKAMKSCQIEVSPVVAGVTDIEINVQTAAQRVRVLAIGD
jgi:hypothetical protein